ncbi:aminoacyl-tRNA hydrolase [Bacillus aquiflavi]|uniref:aminoacyl-tRNA hydrolase n=1 Tax=Bacillus aquiflavi TaxID=2672567 RepID=UPI001CA9134B|nr:aminoacyl-tRNA hydrolase [Bacillus aquiflavi]UAC48231.1 aminoacyl-tRNA hydrolase [Bacillus aquiflavi]
MKLVVGLGNPGKQYEETRHNIGFKVIDELSHRLNIPLDQTKFKGIYGIGFLNQEKIILLKPLTYMNLSGESIQGVMNYYHIDLDDLLVIYDDLDLPVGKIRLRQKGSAGGHNGIKSAILHVGSQHFKRIRVGIDRPRNGMSVSDYVLGRFTSEKLKKMKHCIHKSADACEEWFKNPFLQVMNDFNQ